MITFNEAIKTGHVNTDEAFTIFDHAEVVNIDDLIGIWKGSEFPSGHPMDGSLTNCGWFGKRFLDIDHADPLLFYTADYKGFFAADPLREIEATKQGVTNIANIRLAVETNQPAARLRPVQYRGVVTVAMIYDQLPIIDYFRKIDDNTLLGAMDRRNDPDTYFFVLRRYIA